MGAGASSDAKVNSGTKDVPTRPSGPAINPLLALAQQRVAEQTVKLSIQNEVCELLAKLLGCERPSISAPSFISQLIDASSIVKSKFELELLLQDELEIEFVEVNFEAFITVQDLIDHLYEIRVNHLDRGVQGDSKKTFAYTYKL